MADYMSAHIKIGGKLQRSKLQEFLSLIQDLSAEDYWSSPPNQEYLQECISDKKPMALYDDQARYGQFEELERFCLQNNLTFKRTSSPKYEYGGQIVFFTPESGESLIGATEDGEPYLDLSQLRHYQEEGLTLSQVIEKVQECDGEVPAFEVVEDRSVR